ncbi:hypothetical protein BT69DRAFT_1278883 [Atractiella rhizophila]|nr:hypothetical protein BT69DRAFT_1278883 [Atractiella rhizophila]
MVGGYPTISLQVPRSGAYLHPSTDPDQPSPDTVFKAKCTLTLSKARTMPEIVITVKGYGKVAVDNYVEEWMSIDKEVFEFSFIIPASSLPYDRGQYGRVYQKLSAIVKGVGVLNSNISSHPNTRELTACGMSFTSTSSLEHSSKLSPKVPKKRTRISIAAAKATIGAPTSKEPYKTLEVVEQFVLIDKKRLPDDNKIPASTFPGTETPINVSHHIPFECNFAVEGQERKVLEVRRPWTFLCDSVLLPASQEDKAALPLEDAGLCLLDERIHEVEPCMMWIWEPHREPCRKYEYECFCSSSS